MLTVITQMCTLRRWVEIHQSSAAVSCSATGPVLGGVKMGDWLTGNLGRAWLVHGVGAWHNNNNNKNNILYSMLI